jgi:hypothetical protein
MAIFPAIEPTERGYDFGAFPMEVATGWAAGEVRFRTGSNALTVSGLALVLKFTDLSQAESQQILDHYAFQKGGATTFTLPGIIWAGHNAAIAPDARYRYLERPTEDSRHGGLVDLTVTLEAAAFTTDMGGVVVPAAAITVAAETPAVAVVLGATYSQSSVYSGNDAATASVMRNGVFAEATQTGTDSSSLEWVRMDFGSVVSFSAIVVGCDFDDTLAGGWGQVWTENRDVEISDDGSTWTTLFNTGTFTQGIQTYEEPGTARYVRITAVDDYLAVTEFYAIA